MILLSPLREGAMARSARVYDQTVDPDAPNNAHSFMLGMIGHAKRVIEFGCGPGHVTKVMQERGCRVTGLEIDPEAARQAERYAEKVLVVDLDLDDFAAKLSGEDFDVALFGDVLEHVRDPLALLRSARALLRGGGYVVVSVPNIAHVDVRLALLSGRFDYGDWGLLDDTHLRFFTRASFERLVHEAGFRMVELRRVVVPAFSSEIAVSRETANAEALRTAYEDPEAETYQFVARLVMDDGDAFVASIAERCVGLETEVQLLTSRLAVVEVKATEAEQAVAEAELRAAGAEQRAAAAELQAIAAREFVAEADERAAAAEGRAAAAELQVVEAKREASAAQASFDAARATTEEAQAKAAQASDELLRLHNTKLLRYTAPARRLYSSLRQRMRWVS
jgi:2-polyprenyl-3-methyl-5-hydroxy-6-metoxy-1,4-benzoquinol methylase